VKTRGFSLMEVMVASGLLAIVGGLLYTSLSSSLSAKEAVEGTSNRYHLARQAMSRMVDEMSMAYLSAHVNTLEPRSITGFVGERDEIHFTALGYEPRIADAKRGGSRELSYFIDVDERTGSQALIRREQPDPDDDLEDGGREQTLLPYVTELSFEYWDPPSEDWKDSWDTQEAATLGRLPTRIRINFTAKMGDEDGIEQDFMTQTKIFLEKPLNFQN
jgi:prepilin-type N-terminal cleavage/methylation domain-containing protein